MTLLNDLPKSKLVKTLQLRSTEFERKNFSDLCCAIYEFRKKVVLELRQINVLFPEYTPHDEDYHISNLFRISDIILENTYDNLNTTELLLLVAAMYGHDWGMSVSKSERYYIATEKALESSPSISLLDDEFDRFKEFIARYTTKHDFDSDEDVDLELWQEYVRQTHAIRSGKRARDYFWNYDNSFASALDKICVGHWLDIKEISEANHYYKDDSINGEMVNVKALTIYIRLIDLFDLAQDRTPYVLWKYINPQNKYSKMEWKKHRALNPITCPDYDNGRVIRISGSTDDHEVYAALMDFKKLCDRYFKESIDFLLNMNDTRCKIGVYLLDWRIEPRNFKPIDISFSLDKQQIFNVLSDEIYNSHPYVFVRELIQNSIDAIALRKEILDRKRVGGDNIGHIIIDFSQTADGDYSLTCRDDGIGMNEYILKNYFSVLGKSYYESNDFKTKGLKMHSISKFGIGILSCFSVADQMEIITKREPYMNEGSKGLRVIISDIQRTFRIEELPEHKCVVGTEIKLHISAAKLQEQLKKNEITLSDYSITNYLKLILKYIDYPILINELGRQTIILKDGFNRDKLHTVFPEHHDYEVFTLEERFPVEQIVNKYDIDTFNKYYDIVRVDIKEDLGINDIQGRMFFAILKDIGVEVKNNTGSWPTDKIEINDKVRIRWNTNNYWREKIWQHSDENRILDVYNKGILLESASIPIDKKLIDLRSDLCPSPYITVNFPDTINSITVSRFSMLRGKDILKMLFRKLSGYVSEKHLTKTTELEPYFFWRNLTYTLCQYHLTPYNISPDYFKDLRFPFINEKGELIYEGITEKSEIRSIPKNESSVVDQYNSTGKIALEAEWKYGKCILLTHRYSSFYNSISGCISDNIMYQLKNTHYLSTVDFWEDESFEIPIPQAVFSIGESNSIIKKVCELLSDFSVSMESDEIKIKEFWNKLTQKSKILHFTEKYTSYFAYGELYYNIDNPKVQMLIKYHWFFEHHSKMLTVDETILNSKMDAFLQLPLIDVNFEERIKDYLFADINKVLKDYHTWIKSICPDITGNEIVLSKDDFIERSLKAVSDDSFRYNLDIRYI